MSAIGSAVNLENHVQPSLRGMLEKVSMVATFFFRQDFSPLALLWLKILDRGGILQKPLPACAGLRLFCLLFA